MPRNQPEDGGCRRTQQEESEFRAINEEHKIWKKNTPFMYDFVITHPLLLPSLTVDWIPDLEEPFGKGYSVQKMILGTHASENEPNYLMLAEIQLPLDDKQKNYVVEYHVDPLSCRGESGNGKVRIIKEINHKGEINRARHMPQNQAIIATKAVTAEIYIFDHTEHPSRPSNRACCPDLRLTGHCAEGFALSWSPFKEGRLLSGSDDSRICLWDINATPTNKSLHAMRTFKASFGVVEDVAWSYKHDHLFGSVGDDHCLHLWDLRNPSTDKPTDSVVAHRREVNSLDFNPLNEWILATGSSDKTINLFDLRNVCGPFHTMQHSNSGEVFQVGWNPKNETALASTCLSRRLNIWDTSRIGDAQPQEEARDGPPELLFIHGGHTSRISEFSWNTCMDWTVASVADDNILQVWQMAETIYTDNNDGILGF